MYKTLFITTLFITLVVNILFLFATKEKPPDLSTSTYISISQDETSSHKRLFLRSNDFYDYSSPNPQHLSIEPFYDNNDSEKNSNNNSSHINQHKTKLIKKKSSYDLKAYNLKESENHKSNYRKKIKPSKSDSDSDHYYKKRRRFLLKSNNQSKKLYSNQLSGEESDSGSIESKFHEESPLKYAFIKEDKNENLRNKYNYKNHAEKDKGDLVDDISGNKASSTSLNGQTSNYNSTLSSRTPNTRLMDKKETESPALHDKNDNPYLTTYDYDDDDNDDDNVFYNKLAQNNDYDDHSALATTISYRPKKIFLDISVKSSKNNVLISVGNNIIYNSKSMKQISSKQNDVGNRNTDGETLLRTSNNNDELLGSEARGIHVVVLNEYHGYIMSKRVFDTYSPQQDEELCLYINMIRDGRIMIFAVRDEASFKMPLNSPARLLLQRLGSEHIMKLKWRDMWAFIVRKTTMLETDIQLGESQLGHLLKSRVNNLAEGLTKSSRFSDWAPPVIIQAKVELLDPLTENTFQNCKWKTNNLDEYNRRLNFCNKVEGYGRICDCDNPTPISFVPAKIENSQLDKIPIIVMASNRPYYLYRMLLSLLAADGVNSSMITVFIDGFYHEPMMVSRLFNLRAIQKKPLGKHSSRISHHYKSSLTATFELFPEAEFAIIFEEDLDIAKDALVYFNQTLKILKNDPSLYCVSAWNDQGYEHSAHDNSLLYRIETMPGLGWMLTRHLYKNELEPYWPSFEQQHDWDMWIRTQGIRKNRECIIPDISRTFHFGSIGTNINSYFQKQYFSKHAFNLVPQKEFANLEQLYNESYERMIDKMVKDGYIIEGNNSNTTKDNNATENTNYLCSLAKSNDFHSLGSNKRNNKFHHKNKSYKLKEFFKEELGDNRIENKDNLFGPINNVIYIEMIDKQDYGNWLKLAKCWHIWDLDPRGQHNSMWRLFLNGKPTMVIGTPASPYSRFKPSYIKPFKIT